MFALTNFDGAEVSNWNWDLPTDFDIVSRKHISSGIRFMIVSLLMNLLTHMNSCFSFCSRLTCFEGARFDLVLGLIFAR
jgi:hypothetical protein